MGLFYKLSCYYQVWPQDVYGAQVDFCAQHGLTLSATADGRDEYSMYTLSQEDNGWAVLGFTGWRHLELQRQIQLYTSRRLWCAGILVFIHDGCYWAYELFANGQVLDRFCQLPEESAYWFGDAPTAGNPHLVAEQFPHIRVEDVAPYVLQAPASYPAENRHVDAPARPGDEFSRYDDCAALDFLRMLGVHITLQDGYVRLLAPPWRTFWIDLK